MQVILLERVTKLGQMGDLVSVKNGYARNFLLPQGKALVASKANVADFEARKADLEARNLETRKEAERLAETLDATTFVLIRAAAESGALYGSVAPRDVAASAREAGYQIDRRQVVLSGPIKTLGLHDVTLRLHPEVEVSVRLNVARTEEEAELQASGRSIQDQAAEEQAAAEFEIAELFDEIGAAQEDDEAAAGAEGPLGGDPRDR